MLPILRRVQDDRTPVDRRFSLSRQGWSAALPQCFPRPPASQAVGFMAGLSSALHTAHSTVERNERGLPMARLVAGLRCRHAAPLAMTVAGFLALAAAPGTAVAGAVAGTAHATRSSQDWPTYLGGPEHNSYARSQKAITPTSARRLVQAWHYGAGTEFRPSPTVSGGAVFIGSDLGWFYKLKQTTGIVLARRFIGHEPAKTCTAIGTVSTATVATDPVTHRPTLYVAGANGYLYALNASSLSLRWKA